MTVDVGMTVPFWADDTEYITPFINVVVVWNLAVTPYRSMPQWAWMIYLTACVVRRISEPAPATVLTPDADPCNADWPRHRYV